MKFVHAADLHLDSPLRGLARHAGAALSRVRTASRTALSNLVELCIEEQAGLLVLSGDIYDGDWRDYSTGLYFQGQMARLREAGIRVALIRGNHDAASQITKNLRLPDNVHELASLRAESKVYDALGLIVHGQSFASRAVTENLAQSYPERVAHLLNIGLLHTCVSGREGHEPYAPCTLDQLKSKGYDYWALGHVHAREVLCTEPWVVFPGNLQGRHARELGAKGATLVSYGAAGIHAVEARALDVVRYVRLTLDLDAVTLFDVALDRAREAFADALHAGEGRTIGVRLVLQGTTALHDRLLVDDAFQEQLRAFALELAGEELWLEKLLVHTHSPAGALAARRAGADALSALLGSLDAAAQDPARLLELARELDELRSKLPAELREGEDGVRLEDPEFIAGILREVEPLLVSRLFGGDP